MMGRGDMWWQISLEKGTAAIRYFARTVGGHTVIEREGRGLEMKGGRGCTGMEKDITVLMWEGIPCWMVQLFTPSAIS